MAVSFGCPLVGRKGELETRVLKAGQRAYATDGEKSKWKTGDGETPFKDLDWDKNEGGDGDGSASSRIEDGEGINSIQQKIADESWDPSLYSDYVKGVIEEEVKIRRDGTNIKSGAFGDNSSMFNGKSQTIGGKSHAEGSKNIALGNNSHVEGNGTFAKGQHSHSEGNTTSALGNASHAEGFGGIAKGDYSHAEGNQTVAEGESSHAEGEATRALNKRSHAEGQETVAEGINAHAEGAGSKAIGIDSHAEGYYTKAKGSRSHAEGFGSKANGDNSHAEGEDSQANEDGAHAEGLETIAKGRYSHTEGGHTVAAGDFQHVQGKYNKELGDEYAHIVGNGEVNKPSNAHTLDWEGNAWYAGKITCGEDKKEVATKDDVIKTIDNKLDGYYTKEEVNDSLADKQDIGNMFTGNLTDAAIDFWLGEELYPNIKALKYYVNDKLSSYETKTDFPDSPTPDDEGRILFDFSDMYNKELRLHTAPSVTIVFQDDVYSEDYISGLSFNSGEKATSFDYTSSGIINWVGTDCVKSGDLSIFQPSPNTHYDIVFYFNGTQFIGLVNGFVPATGNG